jgi:hypothetical protein
MNISRRVGNARLLSTAQAWPHPEHDARAVRPGADQIVHILAGVCKRFILRRLQRDGWWKGLSGPI